MSINDLDKLWIAFVTSETPSALAQLSTKILVMCIYIIYAYK